MQGVVTGCEIEKYAPPTKAKNRFDGWYLYCGECQRIMIFCQQKEYSFLSPIKQRIRDSFAEATESGEGKGKDVQGAFTFIGWGTVIAGTAIILGGDSNKFKALPENLASFQMMTEWVDAKNVPPPQHSIVAF